MTKPIINPDDFSPEAIAAQVAAFEARGGKAQQIPMGQSAEVLLGLAEASKRRAKAALGTQNAAASKKTRRGVKPSAASQINYKRITEEE